MIKREKKLFKSCALISAFFLINGFISTTVLANTVNNKDSDIYVSQLDESENSTITEGLAKNSTSASANVNFSIDGETIVGNTIEISINVNSVSNLYGASIDWLYDPSILEVQEINQGNLFSGKISQPLISKINNGQVTFATSLIGASTPISGSGTIATIKAKILKAGNINLKNTNDYSKLSLYSYTTCIKITNNTGSKIGYSYTDKVITTEIEKEPTILASGTYQDTHPEIIYKGDWRKQSGSYDEGTVMISNTANSYVRFAFEGTSFEWYGTLANSRGIAKINIDGVDIDTIDCYKNNAAFTQLIYKSPILSNGVHTVKITVTNTKNAASSIIGFDIDKLVINPSAPITEGTYQESISDINYNGSWKKQSGSYDGGTVMISNTANSTAEFIFKGTSFEWYGTKANSRSIAKITIDGIEMANVDCYSATAAFTQLLYASPSLSNGEHSVKITVLNSKNPSAAAIGIDIDKLVVKNTVPALSVGSYQESSTMLEYSGTWRNQTGSYDGGNVMISNTANSTVQFTFTGTSFEWYGTKANSRGIAKISIDGIDITNVDCYSVTAKFTELIYKSPTLDSGKHTVKITVLPNKNTSATIIGVDIDKLVINDTIPSMTAGTYQEADNGIKYSGTWRTQSGSYDGGNVMISNTANSTAEFTFTGTSFEWYGTKAQSRGIANVTIDGVSMTDVDCYSSTSKFTELLYKSPALENKEHTVKITILNSKNSSASTIGVDIDKLVITNNSFLSAGTYQEDVKNIKYSSNWKKQTGSYDGGNVMISNTADSTVEFDFYGSSFEWYGTKAQSRSIAKITIDGVDITNVDCYNSTAAFTQLIYKSSNLEKDTHKVKITVLNSKNPSASAIGIDIDKLKIS